KGSPELAAFGLHQGGVQVAHLADCLWHTVTIADRAAGAVRRRHPGPETGVAHDVGHRLAVPVAAKAAHAVAHIQKESLPLLLAVVANVDPGRDLLAHHMAG